MRMMFITIREKKNLYSRRRGIHQRFQQTDAGSLSVAGESPLPLARARLVILGKGTKGSTGSFLGVPPRADHGADLDLHRSGLKFS